MAVNPTEAKEIALEWLALLGQKPTPALMARIIKQVKGLMEVGFSDEEIRYTMKVVVRTKPDVYSFGYVEACINDVLRKRAEERRKAEVKQISKDLQEEAKPILVTSESEVSQDDEVSERNRRKAERFGIQSRVREKSYFHLFER
jgi:DNA-binding transcriptional MerR regulator